MLKKLHFNPLTKTYWRVRNLYHSAFPPEERPPYALLWLFSLKPAVDFSAYYDENQFLGLSYVVKTSQGRFVLFLAVADAQRSRGYGSIILRDIARQMPNLPCFLCMEPMDRTAPNYPQRLKRLTFYEKNGYRRQYHYYHELGVVYELLATQEELDYHKVEEELNRYSLGLLKIRID